MVISHGKNLAIANLRVFNNSKKQEYMCAEWYRPLRKPMYN